MAGDVFMARLDRLSGVTLQSESKNRLIIRPGCRKLRQCASGPSHLVSRFLVPTDFRKIDRRRFFRVAIKPVRKYLPGASPRFFVKKCNPPVWTTDFFPVLYSSFVNVPH